VDRNIEIETSNVVAGFSPRPRTGMGDERGLKPATTLKMAGLNFNVTRQ